VLLNEFWKSGMKWNMMCQRGISVRTREIGSAKGQIRRASG